MSDQSNLESWDGFLGSNFLSAEDVKDNQIFVCVGVEFDAENERPMLNLESNGVKSKFSLNVTNAKYLAEEKKIKSPKEMIGKKIVFRKTMAYSPSAKKDVPTLRFEKIE